MQVLRRWFDASRPNEVILEPDSEQQENAPMVLSKQMNAQVRAGQGKELEFLLEAACRAYPELPRTFHLQVLQAYAWPPVPAESVVLGWPRLPDDYSLPDYMKMPRFLGLGSRKVRVTMEAPTRHLAAVILSRSGARSNCAMVFGTDPAEVRRQLAEDIERDKDYEATPEIVVVNTLADMCTEDDADYETLRRYEADWATDR